MTAADVRALMTSGAPIHLKFVRVRGRYAFGLLKETFHQQLVPAGEKPESAGELSIYPGQGLRVSGESREYKLSWDQQDVGNLEKLFGLKQLPR